MEITTTSKRGQKSGDRPMRAANSSTLEPPTTDSTASVRTVVLTSAQAVKEDRAAASSEFDETVRTTHWLRASNAGCCFHPRFAVMEQQMMEGVEAFNTRLFVMQRRTVALEGESVVRSARDSRQQPGRQRVPRRPLTRRS